MSFKVIVDSCCDLTPSLLREEDFLSVPLTIRVGDHVVVDDASFDQADLLWRMKECETAPQTSCPAPAQYLDAFACGADDLYVITLSALLSGSHNSAQQARQLWLEEHPQARVHIFNSCSASPGRGASGAEGQRAGRQRTPLSDRRKRGHRFLYGNDHYVCAGIVGQPA